MRGKCILYALSPTADMTYSPVHFENVMEYAPWYHSERMWLELRKQIAVDSHIHLAECVLGTDWSFYVLPKDKQARNSCD